MKKPVFTLFLCLLSFLATAQMAITSERWDQRQISLNGRPQIGVQNAYEVLSISVDAVIKDQIAEVSVTQRIYNPGNTALEVEIFFPLPNQGIVQNFMMMVNGQEIPGKLMKQEEARSIYEEIVRRKRDPALMEYVGYGLFKTSVFPIAIGEERDITVRYTQICDRHLNHINFTYPFGTQKFSAKALRSVSLKARIESSYDIKSIYSPSDEISVQRQGERKALVKMEKSYVLPTSDFKLVLSAGNGDVGASLLSYKAEATKPGYFMLLASPAVDENIKQSAKTVIFVLDRSGSMAGKKMEQSRKALSFVLDNLNEDDLYNIVAYDDRVETFKPELERYNRKSNEEAQYFVQGISAGGGTNIQKALVTAMEMLKDDKRPSYIIFLTDGQPTTGSLNEMDIARDCAGSNKVKARVFAFGVGNDVNARLLDRISSQNNGISEYVQPGEDIEASVGRLYSHISSPVLTDIRISFGKGHIQSTYPEVLPDLYKGGQITWVGKYSQTGATTVTITGKQNGVEKTYSFPVEFASHTASSTHDYLEKIWASRRIGHLINQIDLHGQNEELVNELVNLSKQYGILTPYTAFLAREDVDLNNLSENIKETRTHLRELDKVQGEEANMQRAYKADMAMNDKAESENIAVNMSGKKEKVNNVRNVGNVTFYNRNNQWIQADISKEEEKKAIQIDRYSQEYFELAKGQPAEFNRYLSLDEDVLVRLNGRVYNIRK